MDTKNDKGLSCQKCLNLILPNKNIFSVNVDNGEAHSACTPEKEHDNCDMIPNNAVAIGNSSDVLCNNDESDSLLHSDGDDVSSSYSN